MSRLIALGAVALLLILLLVRRIWNFRNHPQAPGNKFANLTHFWYLWKIWQGDFHHWNMDEHVTHGKVIRVAPNMYSIDDPEAIKIIYGISSPMPKSEWYSGWGDIRVPNHNLFSARDPQLHAGMRRKVATYYSMTTIKSYEPYVNNCISILLRKLDAIAAAGEAFDLQRWMQCYAFDVIGEISFGYRIGFIESGAQDIGGIMGDLENAATFSTLLGVDFRLLPLMFARYGNPAMAILAFTQRSLEAERNAERHEPVSDAAAESFNTKLEKLRQKEGADFEKYRVDTTLTTNVGAGSDTTSISLTAILFYLAKEKWAYAKLRAEIADAAQRGELDDSLITFEQAQKLPYLQMVIKEGLRMHPATGLPKWRIVPEEGATIASQYFPPKTIVGINPWVAHYNASVFGADAGNFRPERWDSVNTAPEQLKLMEHYYIPFGAGTRTCIGKNISMLEITKLIPELVRRYDVELFSQHLNSTNHWFVKQKDVQIRVKKAETG